MCAGFVLFDESGDYDFGGDTSRVVDKPNLYLISELPVRSKITSAFGPRLHPIFHRRIMHQGIDFRAKLGQPINNVLDGAVVHAGPRGGFGNAVYIYHPAAHVISVYAHLSSVDVKVGEKVHQGQSVGKAGATGFATAVHLHFAVKNEKGKWIDPIAFLRQVPNYQLAALKERVPQSSVLALQLPLPQRVPTRKEIVSATRKLDASAPKPSTFVAPPVVAAVTPPSSPSALNATMLNALNRPQDVLRQISAATANQGRPGASAISARFP